MLSNNQQGAPGEVGMVRADSDDVAGTASIAYACEDCGRVHNRNNPPCNDCGSMNLSVTEAADDPTRLIDENESWNLVRDANQGITGVGVFVSLVGVTTALLGLALLVLGSRIVGPAFLAGGVLATPAIRRRFEGRLPMRLSPVAVLVLYLGLCVGGVVLALIL